MIFDRVSLKASKCQKIILKINIFGGGDILKEVGDGEEYDQCMFYKKLKHIKPYYLLEV